MNSQQIQQQFRQVIQRWFISYNPLYFFSAFCVLGGMYLVSFGLEEMLWTRGQLMLSGIVQCYEFLLIGSAALLYRRVSLARPAVILGLIELSFLFDCTFRAEIFTSVDFSGTLLTAFWIALSVAKLSALLWAFRLKASVPDVVLPLVTVIVVAVVPQFIDRHYAYADAIHVSATCFGVVLIAVLSWRRLELSSLGTLSEWGQTVLQRSLMTFRVLLVGFYGIHLFAWVHLFNVHISVFHVFALCLLLLLLTKQKELVWIVCAGVLAFNFTHPSWLAPIAAIVGILFVVKALQLREQRFYIGAVLACYISIWTLGWQAWPLPPLNVLPSLAAALVLLVMAWKFKLPSALIPLTAGTYPFAKIIFSLSSVQKGIVLLAFGFMALLIGVAFNWRQSRHQVEET